MSVLLLLLLLSGSVRTLRVRPLVRSLPLTAALVPTTLAPLSLGPFLARSLPLTLGL